VFLHCFLLGILTETTSLPEPRGGARRWGAPGTGDGVIGMVKIDGRIRLCHRMNEPVVADDLAQCLLGRSRLERATTCPAMDQTIVHLAPDSPRIPAASSCTAVATMARCPVNSAA
jgi:hypothetical protein